MTCLLTTAYFFPVLWIFSNLKQPVMHWCFQSGATISGNLIVPCLWGIQGYLTLLMMQLLVFTVLFPIFPMFDNSRFPVNNSGSMFDFTRTQTWFFNVLFIMLQNHLILHLILLTQPEVTQCYEIATHYPFRLYNISPSRITIIALMWKFLL